MTQAAEGYATTTTLLYRAAVGLAAAHFPAARTEVSTTVSSRDVAFLLDGHVDAWPAWTSLAGDETRQVARLLRLRPVELADREAIERDLQTLLAEEALPGCRLTGEDEHGLVITCTPGMPTRDFIDTTLDELESASRLGRGLTPTAGPGAHQTTFRVAAADRATSRVVDSRYVLPNHAVSASPSAVAPTVTATPGTDEILVPTSELVEVAARLDAARDGQDGSSYRARHVESLCRRMQSRRGTISLTGLLSLVAGTVRLLNAPPGSGKSILMEVLACWAAPRGFVVTLVVPTNADVLKLTHAIEHDLQALDLDTSVTALMSPRSMFETMRTVVRSKPSWDPSGEWTFSRLGYACALPAAASADASVDAWQPGDEPCTTLQPAQPEDDNEQASPRRYACPWRMSCGKFRLARAATTASVIVTSHTNLHTGRVHLPVRDDRGVTDRMSVEELVFRRSHLVVIDEIDAFQADVLSQAARGLLLDHASGMLTPLRRLDTEFGPARGRVHRDVDAAVRDLVMHARFLAETYVSSLFYGRLGPAGQQTGTRRRGPGRSWIVPRRWDGWLTARLFQLADDEPITQEQVLAFRSLFPDETPPTGGEPAFFPQMRTVLHNVSAMGNGAGVIETSRVTLDQLLTTVVPDVEERSRAVDRLLRRALLERLRNHLRQCVFHVPHLGAAGVEAAQDIAETFGPYNRWRVTPNGPLGRLLFAFTEHFDPNQAAATRLQAAAFGGDPHVYTRGLADTTALCRAGARRAALGLSATAYFPRAPHHHVHLDPEWWVRDDDPHGVRIQPAPITATDRRLVGVSGKEGGARTQAQWTLARLLWQRRLRSELQRLAADEPQRARILLATTSYDGAHTVAQGLVAAGAAPKRICLAVRPKDAPDMDGASHASPSEAEWHELAADRLEEFPRLDSADILVAPLARVQRGVNLIGADDRSALGSIWLIVRPVPVIDEPAELIAHVNAHVLDQDPMGDMVRHLGETKPADILQARRDEAGYYFERIVTSLPYFRTMPKGVRLSITAEIMNGIIQLVGRARRGGTPATIHLADGAFLDPGGGPTFAELIHQLREHWEDSGELSRMLELYGPTLEAFFAYADTQAALLADS